ncbi:MAG TPA: UDP-N-acetylmuramoyl-tripeptide--D-alanyl-D-alanine ligase [Syntrophothermus lipocalidus]|nr:UDP-N-acetylmuramoyl-tripeptide--D-alanyl-D-alanine ligase [Syntrophothermus lipocalidus]
MYSRLLDIARAIEGNIIQGRPDIEITGVSLNSRRSGHGDVFFALKGDRHDGHDFIPEALRNGALAAVVSRPVSLPQGLGERGLISVRDVKKALQMLARWHRQRFKLHLVGVTGSVGKTTTKDLTATCLEARFQTLKTEGNYNNEIGVPLTLLRLDHRYEACVVEMAMRNLGEIEELASIALPTCGIIVNVEPVHLENLGSMERIAQAKCELFKYVDERGFVAINGDNPLLVEAAEKYAVKKVRFGWGANCDDRMLDVNSSSEETRIKASLAGQAAEFCLPFPGSHLAYNVIAAAGVAVRLGVDLADIQSKIRSFSPSSRRLNIKTGLGGITIIDDCYNANPVSMKAGLEVLSDVAAGRYRVAVLGDMYELGSYEVQGHREVGYKAAELGVERLVTVGELARHIGEAAKEAGLDKERILHFSDKELAIAYLKSDLPAEAVVLIKASRGMHMEDIVQELEV